jgi:DNA modification methylase
VSINPLVLRGDARRLPLPDACVDLIVTSPPYFGLRSYTDAPHCRECEDMIRNGRDPRQAWPDYQAHWDARHVARHYDGQIGSEATPAEFLAALWACTAEWVRVLKPSGSIFVNLGDKYGGRGGGVQGVTSQRPGRANITAQVRGGYIPGDKSLMGLPWRYALGAIDQAGLILRAEIVWAKPNGLPESVTDRVRRAHEQVFHFTRQPRYYAAVDEIREPQTGSTTARSLPGFTTRDSHDGSSHRAMRRDPEMFNPLGKLPGSVWTIPSAPLTVPAHLGVDHFAAFPPALVRPIVAGWSPPGVCTACGEGRRPVWVRPDGSAPDDVRRLYDRKAAFHRTYKGLGGQAHQDWLDANPKERAGYACACAQPTAPTRPSVVVDPFGGTGTTALVASVLGRLGISVDLSHDYSRLARWRTRDPGERARAADVPKPPPVMDGQQALFDDVTFGWKEDEDAASWSPDEKDAVQWVPEVGWEAETE